jgi:hypothetical protein
MHKRPILVIISFLMILIVGISFTGCSQETLTEEQVRSIVREEISMQIASMHIKDIVEQEVTKQMPEINDIVSQEVTKQLPTINDYLIQVVKSQLISTDELILSELYIKNDEGKIVGGLSSSAEGHGIFWLNTSENKRIVWLGGSDNEHGGGVFELCNRYGDTIFLTGTLTDSGHLIIQDRYGNVKFAAPLAN